MKKMLLALPILAGVLWGSVGVFVRVLSDFGLNNPTILSARVLIAAIILFVGLLIYDRSILKIRFKDLWLFVASGLLGMVGLNLCYNESISQLSLSLAAVLLSMAPLFTIIIAAFLFKEKITVKKIGCMVLAIIGCVLVSGLLESQTGVGWGAAGIIAGALAALFFALYGVFSKLAMNKGYKALTVTFYSLLVATIALIPFTDWAMLGSFVSTSYVQNTAFLVLHSLCTSVLPYVLFTIVLNYVETGITSLLAAASEPAAAMVFGALFFAEVPTVLSFVGLLVTITALTLLLKPTQTKAAG